MALYSSKRSRATFESDSHAPYVFYGTPLPAYDREARDDGSYLPLWKQEVRDEQGRKRLHGAFTGGWSAGYFNTVGSKEGWTPSTFISSRSNRAKDNNKDASSTTTTPATARQPLQKVEDFMDEEDLRDAEEARTLHTASTYAGIGGNAAAAADTTTTTKSAFINNLFRPSAAGGGETVGVRLLKRMGWREGQGIGPMIRRRARLGGGGGGGGGRGDGDEEVGFEGEEEEEEEEEHYFAPENTPVVQFAHKMDRCGVGFVGEEGLSRSGVRGGGGGGDDEVGGEGDYDDPFSRLTSVSRTLQSSQSLSSSSSRKKQLGFSRDRNNTAGYSSSFRRKKGGGIGTGVLNSDDDEEEDPYEIAPRISYNRVIDADKKARKQKKQKEKEKAKEKELASLDAPATTTTVSRTSNSNPLLSTKPVFIKRKPGLTTTRHPSSSTLEFKRCRNGRLPLPGFLLSITLSNLSLAGAGAGDDQNNTYYPPPKVPSDWQPKKTKQAATTTTTTTTTDTTQTTYRPNASFAHTSSSSSSPPPPPPPLNPTTRAALLGEKQLPGPSVYDFMTPEARERIARATGRTDLPPARGQKGPGLAVQQQPQQQQQKTAVSDWRFVPHLDRYVARQALERGMSGAFMPYAEDEAKRGRYRAFLALKGGGLAGEEEQGGQDREAGKRENGETLPERPSGMNFQEWIAEMNEFVRCAMIFRPASGLMASRFTSASASSSSSSSSASAGNMMMPPPGEGSNLLRQPGKPPKALTPAEEAAKLGMYGHLTRETEHFQPSRLLCKRFGVAMPVPSDTTTTSSSSFRGASSDIRQDVASPAAAAAAAAAAGKGEGGGGGVPAEPTATAARSALLSTDAMNRIIADAQTLSSSTTQSAGAGGGVKMGAPTVGLRKPVIVDPERNEALEAERPGDEVFRAIFGDEEGDVAIDD